MVNSYPAAVAQTTNLTRNVLGKRTAEEIIQKKMEDIIGMKLVDYRHPKKKQKIVNGGVPSSKNMPQAPPATSQATGSKTLFLGNLSYSVEESDILNLFKDAGEVVRVRLGLKDDRLAGYGHVEFANSDAAQNAIKLNGEILLGRPVILDFATERGANTPSKGNERSSQKSGQSQGLTVPVKGFGTVGGGDDPFNSPQTPATSQTTGSKTLFVGNLSFSVKKSDILNFFKDAGEVVQVRFAFLKGDRFAGYGHVEFATSDAAQNAIKLNGENLLDRPVRLEFATETGANTPSNGNERSSQKSGQSQGLTVIVKGFGTVGGGDDPFDSIRISLEEHFMQCGEITRMYIPRTESDYPQGVAYIDFSDSEAFNKALELSGSKVGGGIITVNKAKQQSGGHGRGKGGKSGGRGRFGGRYGGRGQGRGRGF